MENSKPTPEELARKIQQCLNEAGVKVDVDVSQHEALVYGRIEAEGQTLRVIAHITDRDVRPAAHGPVAQEIARTRLAGAIIRPTLSSQAASGTPSDQENEPPLQAQ